MIIRKQTKTLPKNIEEKLDAQLANLKQMILDNYRDATAYELVLESNHKCLTKINVIF